MICVESLFSFYVSTNENKLNPISRYCGYTTWQVCMRRSTRVEISSAYGHRNQLEIEGNQRNQKSSCRARAAFLVHIAPLTVVNYKADPAAARAHASHVPAGRPHPP